MPVNENVAEIVAKLSQLDNEVILKAIAQTLLNEPKKVDVARTCPHCGYNLVQDRLMIKDGFIIDPRGQVFYGEKQIKLGRKELHILATIMKEGGRTIEYSTLSSRTVNARRSDDRLLLRQHAHNIRRKLTSHGVPYPIKPEHGIGYYWHVDKET